ncbi:hypothetical protein D3C76_910810 [compost metagenome]
MLALEAGHHQLVLVTQYTLGAEQPGTVAVAPIAVQHRYATRLQVDSPAPGKALAQGLPELDQRLDTGDGGLQVTPLLGTQLPAEHQPGVLRQQQQAGPRFHRFGTQALQVVGVGLPGFMQLDGVLAGRQADHIGSSLSQNDISLSELSCSSRSRQA